MEWLIEVDSPAGDRKTYAIVAEDGPEGEDHVLKAIAYARDDAGMPEKADVLDPTDWTVSLRPGSLGEVEDAVDWTEGVPA